MTRPLTDLANDLRSGSEMWRVYSVKYGADRLNEAADVLDLLATLLPQPVCDTCGGDGFVSPYPSNDGDPCPSPHCDDGRLALDVWLRRVGALWAFIHAEPQNDGDDMIRFDHLRQVGRQA